MAWPSSMPGKLVLTLVLVWMCVAFVDEVGGKRLPSDMELKRELNALKIIKLQNGDIFDCIDIYKQPALDHPLLKNHKIQLRPSGFPKGTTANSVVDEKFLDFGYNESCPLGTVPIRRTQEEDLRHAEFLQFSQRKYTSKFPTQDIDTTGIHFAKLESKKGTYYGSRANLVVYGLPSVTVGQSSVSQILVAGGIDGPSEQINAIHVGWHADGYNQTGCINTGCQGFVTAGQKIVLGSEISPLSTYGGVQYSIHLTIFRDPDTRNWWLLYGEDGYGVGYFPKELFTHLDTADRVDWGGTVYSPPDKPSPPMGSGHFPVEGVNKTCYVTEIRLVNEKNEVYKPGDVHIFADIPAYYDAQNNDDVLAYGGPGGFKP